MRTSCFVLAIIVAMGLMVTQASAYATFSDDFTGGASANWANPEVADYSNDNAAFNGVGDSERIYLYTVDTNYNVGDFVATVDLTNNNNMPFFGLGPGIPNSDQYYEPQTDPFVFVRFNAGSFTPYAMHVIWSDDWPGGQYVDTPNLPAGTTIRAELSWESATTTATFRFDIDLDGTYDCDYSAVVEELGEVGATARLFVGGTDGDTVDNFSVLTFSPGDADKDGDVDDDDAAILASNWLTTSDATWGMGDFNGDKKVDDIDATILATNWVGNTAAWVPEPSVIVLLSMGALGLLVSKWRIKHYG